MKGKNVRIDDTLAKELEDIRRKRVISGLDREMKSIRRLTMGIRRHSMFQKIKEDLISADMPD